MGLMFLIKCWNLISKLSSYMKVNGKGISIMSTWHEIMFYLKNNSNKNCVCDLSK